jgi:hypothetical protein
MSREAIRTLTKITTPKEGRKDVFKQGFFADFLLNKGIIIEILRGRGAARLKDVIGCSSLLHFILCLNKSL